MSNEVNYVTFCNGSRPYEVFVDDEEITVSRHIHSEDSSESESECSCRSDPRDFK